MGTIGTRCRPQLSPEPPLSSSLNIADLLSPFFPQFSLPFLLCYEQNFLFRPLSKTPKGWVSITWKWPSYLPFLQEFSQEGFQIESACRKERKECFLKLKATRSPNFHQILTTKLHTAYKLFGYGVRLHFFLGRRDPNLLLYHLRVVLPCHSFLFPLQIVKFLAQFTRGRILQKISHQKSNSVPTVWHQSRRRRKNDGPLAYTIEQDGLLLLQKRLPGQVFH